MTTDHRIIGDIRGTEPGPVLICLGGLHGNEPAGILALERVFTEILAQSLPVRGRIIGVRGNLKAIQAGKRFVSEDLNRLWRPATVEGVTSGELSLGAETDEMRSLLELIDSLGTEQFGLLDFHTTSSPTVPFAWLIPDRLEGKLVRDLPIPVVYDIEERIPGTMSGYFANQGHLVACVEGGQHDSEEAISGLESIFWLVADRNGNIDATSTHVQFERSYEHLEAVTASLPRKLAIIHHHRITPADEFQMKAGYRNFQPLEEGEVIAHDKSGEVKAPRDCRLLMPLYQPLGEDGFLLVSAMDDDS